MVVADCETPRFCFCAWTLPAIPSYSQYGGRGYMENKSSCKSAERISLEGELQSWFAGQGVSVESAARAVQLLDANVLLAQPRPSRWNRKGNFGDQERCRYLWYRHAARILGWCERRRFPDIVTGILRTHVFPPQVGRDETTREDAKGITSAASRAGSHAIEYAHHASGNMPTGHMPPSIGAREHTGDTETKDTTAEQGDMQTCPMPPSIGAREHTCDTETEDNAAEQGAVGSVRGGPGRWEGECRPGCKTKAIYLVTTVI